MVDVQCNLPEPDPKRKQSFSFLHMNNEYELHK
jgi:hypothetical protein